MIFWYFLIIVAFVWISFATVTDIKKREVPDWLSYSLIAIGFGARIIYSIITKDYRYILFGVIGFIAAFAFANLMYYTKQWGGGDAKLLMGLGVLFGNYQLEIFNAVHKLPFLLTLIINLFVAGALYGIIYSLIIGIKNRTKVLKELKNKDFKQLKFLALGFLVLIIIALFIFNRNLSYLIIILLLLAFLFICLVFLMRIIEGVSFYKYLEVNKLTEGDWLVNNIIKNNKIICKVRNIGLTKQDITILKKNNIKKVLIKEGIPFVPGFLIGFVITIIFGDLILLFF